MKAYLQFKGGEAGPFQTIAVDVRETKAPPSGRSVTGYGPKIATPYLVKWEGRWRRVYVANYGNAGTAYIGKPGAWLCTVEFERGAA